MVTVYTKPNCPHCVHTKKMLKDLGIAFDEVDVTQDAKALAKIKDEWGFKVVPVVEAGDDVWAGHQPERIKKYAE